MSHPLCPFYCTGNHMESNVKSLCGSEVSWKKIKQLKVEWWGHVPQCPIAGDANAQIHPLPNSWTFKESHEMALCALWMLSPTTLCILSNWPTTECYTERKLSAPWTGVFYGTRGWLNPSFLLWEYPYLQKAIIDKRRSKQASAKVYERQSGRKE